MVGRAVNRGQFLSLDVPYQEVQFPCTDTINRCIKYASFNAGQANPVLVDSATKARGGVMGQGTTTVKAASSRGRAGVFFSLGYRPFFLGASLYAALALFLWLWILIGGGDIPTAFSTVGWHRHEMLFGVIGAVVAGFLLTAVPNWTGRPPLSGWPLAALFGLWLSARLALAFSGVVGIGWALVLEAGFFFSLTGWGVKQIIVSRNRNVPIPLIIGILGLMAMGDYLVLFGEADLGDIAYRGGLGILLLLISLIGGRIVPIFTKNWLGANQRSGPLPTAANSYDKLVVLVTFLALASWAAVPFSRVSAILALLAGFMHSFRLLRWRGWRTSDEPLIMIMHLAYMWLPVGFILLGVSILSDAVPHMAAVHALTAGAMGAMTLAVMMRATLGHSGYPLVSTPLTNIIFLAVSLGALGRIASTFWLDWTYIILGISGGLWAGAYLLFAVGFGPLLLSPRAR